MPRKGKHPASYDDDDYDDGYYDGVGDDDQDVHISGALSFALPANNKESSSAIALQQAPTWICPICTFDNPAELQSCDICGAIKHSLARNAPSNAAVKRPSISGSPSALAKSLFAPLPEGKLKIGSIQQVKERPQRRDSIFVPLSVELGRRDIVPFKFDTPSPDDVVLAGKKVATNSLDAVKNLPVKDDKGVLPKSSAKKVIQAQKKVDQGQGAPVALKDKADAPSSTWKSRATIVEKLDALDLNAASDNQGNVDGCTVPPLESYEPEGWMLEEFKNESSKFLHLAIIGHVDAGKSTLMGRILHLLGKVSQKEMHKYEKEAKQTGKGSFSYAWVLDESPEERERGVTMTVAVATFETPKFRVVLLDSPGHKDFVPNMISGASQADAAVLVIDASVGAFEAGLEGEGQGSGQTREHTQLIRSFGVEQLIVAVNKMDAVDYSQERFNTIKTTLRPFLKHCGFKDSAVKWVPLSAMDNQNLVTCPSASQLKAWYTGPTLFDAIDMCKLSERDLAKPFRMTIAETTRSRSLGQAAVSGKIEAGAIKVGSKLLVMPAGNIATVKGIQQDGKTWTSTRAGDSVELGLQGVDPSFLIQGGVLCHPDYPVPVTYRLELKALMLENSGPLLRGSQVVFHCHHLKEPAKITELVSVLDPKTGSVVRKKPRCVLANQTAIVEVVPERGVCVEEYARYKALGRVSLRDRGKTLAVGIVTHIFDCA